MYDGVLTVVRQGMKIIEKSALKRKVYFSGADQIKLIECFVGSVFPGKVFCTKQAFFCQRFPKLAVVNDFQHTVTDRFRIERVYEN